MNSKICAMRIFLKIIATSDIVDNVHGQIMLWNIHYLTPYHILHETEFRQSWQSQVAYQ